MRRFHLAPLALVAAWSGLAHAQVPPRRAQGEFPEPPPAEAAPPPATVEPVSPPPAPAEPAPAPVAEPLPSPAAAPSAVDGPASPPNRPSKFYSALGLGGGYFHATSGDTDDTRRFSGGSFAVQLVMGGRIGKGRTLTLGGAYLRDQVYGLSAKDEVIDGDEPHLDHVSLGLWLLGFFVDVAVKPEPGLHFQAIAGFGAIDVAAPSRDSDDPSGLALNLGVGYDFRVGQHLALGALLRGTYAPFNVDENSGTAVTSLAPSLLFTATTR